MRPIELSTWVAKIWPSPQTERAIADQVIRAAGPVMLQTVRRKFPGMPPNELLAAVQFGVWRSLRTFDPKLGAFFCHSVRYAHNACVNARVEPRIPIVWPGAGHATRQSEYAPHVTGWRDRETRGETNPCGAIPEFGLESHEFRAIPAVDALLECAERIDQIDRALRFIRLDLRPAIRRHVLDGETLTGTAAALQLSRFRVQTILAEWREVLTRTVGAQVAWLEARASACLGRRNIPGPDWGAIAADYRALAATLRTQNGISPQTARPLPRSKQQLVDRVTAVRRLRAEGRSNAEIGEALGLSTYAVARALLSKVG